MLTPNVDIVYKLRQYGEHMDGECSVSVILELKDGRRIRVGVTDDDVAETPGFAWVQEL